MAMSRGLLPFLLLGSANALNYDFSTLEESDQSSLRGRKMLMFENDASAKGELDIVIGMESDYGVYQNINASSELFGFDVGLVQLICEDRKINCGVVTAPWQAMVAGNYKDLGWATNPKTYLGLGFMNGWFHCSSGTFNNIMRQQSAAFSDPYTDPAADHAVFVGLKGGTTTMAADASDVTVGFQNGDAAGAYFAGNYPKAKQVMSYKTPDALYAALDAKEIDVFFYAKAGIKPGTNSWKEDKHHFVGEPVTGWASGVSFMCQPGRADLAKMLSDGLKSIKANGKFTALCNNPDYSGIVCDTKSTVYSGNRQMFGGQNVKADILIGTEADYDPYNNMNSKTGVLEGFDVELTKKVCEMGKVNCAFVPAPWQSMMASNFPSLGWSKTLGNPKAYPGVGFQNSWFHCSAGTFNKVDRQQGALFTNPYTDPTNDKAVFTGLKGKTMKADASDVTVGIVGGDAVGGFFLAQQAEGVYKPLSVKEYGNNKALFKGLAAGEVNAVFFAKAAAIVGNGYDSASMEFLKLGPDGPVDVLGWGFGVSFMCHAGRADVVAKLNAGLDALKASDEWGKYCAKHPAVKCDTAKTQFTNKQAYALTGNKDKKADIFIGTEADYSPYNNINPVSKLLEGFDMELTTEVCKMANVNCAITTAPWQTMQASNYADLGFPGNRKGFPGLGFMNQYYDCSVGSFNLVSRQQSLLFSNPYTDPTNDKAAFTGLKGKTMKADASDVKVGIVGGDATGSFFLAEQARGTYKPLSVETYGSNTALFKGLAAGEVNAVFFAKSSSIAGNGFNSATMEFLKVGPAGSVDVLGWGFGVSYMCHPGKADVVAKLNKGLDALKATAKWTELCAKYPTVKCDTAMTQFTNWQGSETADVIIGTEADYSPYNNINSATGLLEGFDIDLVPKVCAEAGIKCNFLPAPWQSMMASSYPGFGWDSNPKLYPGVGFQNQWFDCSAGTFNIVARQQSLLFTSPYTDPKNDKAVFVGKKGGTMKADASDVKVGIVGGDATGSYFLKQQAEGVYKPLSMKTYGSNKALFKGLADGDVNAVFFAKAAATMGNGFTEASMEFLKVGPDGPVDVLGWGFGVSFMCHVSKAAIQQKLNKGLASLKKKAEWGTLCAKHAGVKCDTDESTFTRKEATVKFYTYPAPTTTAAPTAASTGTTAAATGTAASTGTGTAGTGTAGTGTGTGSTGMAGTTAAATNTDASDAWQLSAMSFAALFAIGLSHVM